PARGRAAVWLPHEIALLGALSDAEVARQTGRSPFAVMKKRDQLRRPALTANGHRKFWSAKEDEAVRTLPPREAARATGRTVRAICGRRSYLAMKYPGLALPECGRWVNARACR